MNIEQYTADNLIPKGKLLIIGGAEDKGEKDARQQNGIKMEVLQCFIALLPVKKGSIEVITTAGSEDPAGTFRKYKKAFTGLGAGNINHIHHDSRELVALEPLKERLEKAAAIFFSGGDQLKLTSIYGGTELLVLLKQRYIRDGLVIGGTSAGAMALSTPMIYGGVGRDEMIAGNVKVTTGLEFLRDVCIDTHFVNRGRFVRIAQVLAENPGSIGIGIEDDTAIIVSGGTEAEVVGCGVVITIEAQQSYGTNITQHEDNVPLTVRGLRVNILSKGQLYSIPMLNPVHL
jgi:cyanophycinase